MDTTNDLKRELQSLAKISTSEFPEGASAPFDRPRIASLLVESDIYTRLVLNFLPEWRSAFQEPENQLDKKITSLKKNLDTLSQKIIDRYLGCYRILIGAEQALGKRLQRYDLLLNPDFFLSGEEIEFKKNVHEKYASLPSSFRIPEEKRHLVDPVQFGLAYGLKFVPEECLNLKEKDVIDGGGFCGDSAVAFCDYSPRKVFSFEPGPESFFLMRQIVELNAREDKIETVPKALARETGTSVLYTAGGEDDGAGFRKQDHKSTIEVPCTSIDDFVEHHQIKPGLIKLDIEGGELDAIYGAVKTIRSFTPVLIISVYHRALDFFEIKPLLEKLVPEYTMVFRQSDFRYPNLDLNLIAYEKI